MNLKRGWGFSVDERDGESREIRKKNERAEEKVDKQDYKNRG